MPSDAVCDVAEEVFEQFSGAMQTMTQVFEEAVISTNEYARAMTDALCLVPELANDAVNEAEEELCLRRSLRCALVTNTLGGSAALWDMREDIARVISHRDGSYTIFVRMFPRLSYGEVKRIQRDLKTLLPEGTEFKLMAVWEKRRG